MSDKYVVKDWTFDLDFLRSIKREVEDEFDWNVDMEGIDAILQVVRFKALRLRVETAEKDAAEAYAKGQRDMREEASKIALLWRCLLPSTCCDNTSDATCQSISEEIKSLPIKERP